VAGCSAPINQAEVIPKTKIAVMKTMISLAIALAVIAGLSASAQVASTQVTPSTALGASNISPVSPGFANVFGTLFQTNVVPATLNTGLAALQNDIQQILPVLANFNNSVAFPALSSVALAANTGGSTTPVPVSGQNLSTRTSANFSTVSSQNLSTLSSQSSAVPVSGTPVGGTFSTAITGTPQPALTPTGVTNPLGLAPNVSAVTTNAFGAVVTPADVIRDLIVLQNDLERLLPVIVTLNGSSLPSGFTNTIGSLNP
jgi:hypothetical protein